MASRIPVLLRACAIAHAMLRLLATPNTTPTLPSMFNMLGESPLGELDRINGIGESGNQVIRESGNRNYPMKLSPQSAFRAARYRSFWLLPTVMRSSPDGVQS